MRYSKRVVLLVIALFMLCAVTVNASSLWVPMVAVNSASVPTPTFTMTPTSTSSPTWTATPTRTPTPTRTASPTVPANVPAYDEVGVVTHIVDGDTIDVALQQSNNLLLNTTVVERVRYVGMDTPEHNQPGFLAASEANQSLVLGQRVYLVKDHSNRDVYGRLLRFVYSGNGTFVNANLVHHGWALPVEYAPDTSHAALFLGLARDAAHNHAGFWGGTSPYDGAFPYALTKYDVLIREGPSQSFATKGRTGLDMPLGVFGRDNSSAWLQIRTHDRIGGWIPSWAVTLNVPLSVVPVPTAIPTPPAATTTPTATPASSGGTGQVTISWLSYSGRDEYISIHNASTTAQSMAGWKIQSVVGNQWYYFPSNYTLAAQSSVDVHSGPDAYSNWPSDLKWTSHYIWNNNGDKAVLYNGSQAVDADCYKSGCP